MKKAIVPVAFVLFALLLGGAIIWRWLEVLPYPLGGGQRFRNGVF